ncbi:BA3454 family stress response protein [Oceanobacillus rekensis]|nr:BA3454 family stress response protein [Oceanobacillus rekensis]
MQEVTVSVVYKGKNYLTNVIANKGATGNEILSVATEQVRKQWKTPQKI